MSRHLIIMAKEPRMGRVKTRLAREIGAVKATQFYRMTTANLIRRLGNDPRWRLLLAIGPETALRTPAWPSCVARVPQGEGGLGERMTYLLQAQAPNFAVLIGSDIPGVRAADIARAFDLLQRHDVVFGPAADGGFWLVGTKPLPWLTGMFQNVRWSSDKALADVLRNLEGRRIGFARRLCDVDDAASYSVAAKLGRLVTLPANAGEAADG